MPFTGEWVDPEVFMTEGQTGRKDVQVYYLYKYDEMSQGPLFYNFSLNSLASVEDGGSGGNFDVRDLPGGKTLGPDDEDAKRKVIRTAIDAGYFDDWKREDGSHFITKEPYTAPDPEQWTWGEESHKSRAAVVDSIVAFCIDELNNADANFVTIGTKTYRIEITAGLVEVVSQTAGTGGV